MAKTAALAQENIRNKKSPQLYSGDASDRLGLRERRNDHNELPLQTSTDIGHDRDSAYRDIPWHNGVASTIH